MAPGSVSDGARTDVVSRAMARGRHAGQERTVHAAACPYGKDRDDLRYAWLDGFFDGRLLAFGSGLQAERWEVASKRR